MVDAAGQLVGLVSEADPLPLEATPDGDVEAGVKQTLAEEGLRLGSLSARVSDGVVELTGNGDRQTLRLAEILARSVPGVLDVRVVERSE